MKTSFQNPEESITLIRSMIEKSRRNFSQNSFYFILWGVLMFAGGLAEFFLWQAQYEMFWIGWPLLSIIGGIVTGIYSWRQEKHAGGSTYTDSIIGSLWLTYGISLILMIFTGVVTDTNPSILVMLLTGLPTFLTGRIVKHTPLKVGGIIFWVGGIAGLLVSHQHVSLIYSAAILLGYLLPGISLLKAERSRHV